MHFQNMKFSFFCLYCRSASELKNGTSNLNQINGYSSRNTNLVGNSSRTFARNTQSQQYHTFKSPHHQQPELQLSPEMRQIEDNVIRLPRGPGGPGFMLKR